ncbi:RNA 2',3'-cyclic phosphodiesterase [Paenibacillus sp. sgz500958]|uniref:RNA 2',3'-cyclic phosphodiesterase n=1 Tax=Paenibacillus sp. sgz500958 TaxID=3242475 RepID=UPI0036D2B67A
MRNDKAYGVKDIKSTGKGEIAMDRNVRDKDSERLFVAVKIPAKERAALSHTCGHLKSELSFAKWTHEEDYHITLQFLGDTAVSQIPALTAALKKAAGGLSPFGLSVSNYGTFGVPSSPRVLWAGVRGDLDSLHELQQAVCAATLPLGFTGEERKYSPHITLARKYRGEQPHFAERLRALQLMDKESGEVVNNRDWSVDGIVLFATRMHKSPMYEIVENITFFER